MPIHSNRYTYKFHTYHVSNSIGDDSYPGTADKPFKTLSKINSLKLNCDDRVLLKAGDTFTGEYFDISRSGKKGRPIYYGRYGSGSNPLIDGAVRYDDWSVYSGAVYRRNHVSADITQVWENGSRMTYSASVAGLAAGAWAYSSGYVYVRMQDDSDPNVSVVEYGYVTIGISVKFNGHSHLTFDNIDITRSNYDCFNTNLDNSHDIVIKNCTLNWSARCILLGVNVSGTSFANCTDITCYNVKAHDDLDVSFWAGRGKRLKFIKCETYNSGKDVAPNAKNYPGDPVHFPNGILISGTAEDCLVSGCYIHDIAGWTLLLDETSPSLSYHSSRTVFENNLIVAGVDDFQAAVKICGYGTTFRNNIIYHSSASTSTFGLELTHTPEDTKIYNNTFISSGSSCAPSIYSLSGSDTLIKNNIFYSERTSTRIMTIGASAQSGFESDYNDFTGGTVKLFWGPTEYTFANWQINSGQDGNSITTTPSFKNPTTDLHLQDDSPCKYTGVNLGIPWDYDGFGRGTSVSMGALEYVKEYYVDASTGNDSNPGTYSEPWLTVQKAVDTATAGYTVYVKNGTYNERVTLDTYSGTSGNPITIKNYPGHSPIISGSGITFSGTAGLFEVRSKDYIILEGLRVINSDDTGFFIYNSDHTKILNNSTNLTHSSGIFVSRSDDILVKGNTVVNARYVDMPHGHEESISIVATTNFEVCYNDVSMDGETSWLGNEGIDCKAGTRYGTVHHNVVHGWADTGGTIYVDAWDTLTGDIDIYCNYIHDTAGGIALSSERGGILENIRVYNNILYKTGAYGVSINSPVAYSEIKRNIKICNNTIYKARWNGAAGIYLIEEQIENVLIANNLIYYNLTNGEIVAVSDVLLPNITAYNNYVYGSKSCSIAYPDCVEISNNPSGYESTIYGNVTTNPLFISTNATTPNMHLALNSPDLHTGEYIDWITTDYEGFPRSQELGYNVGALGTSSDSEYMGSRDFNGSTDRIDWANVANLSGSAVTVSLWVYLYRVNTDQYLFHVNVAAETIGLHLSNLGSTTGSGSVQFNRKGTTTLLRYSATSVLSTGVWTNIIATHDGTFNDYTKIHIYKNGTEVTYSGGTNGATETALTGSWNLGARSQDDARNTDGQIAQVGVWNRVLSSGEISDLTAGDSPDLAAPSNLLFYFKGNTDSLYNSVSGGSQGTADGTTYVSSGPEIVYP